MVVMKDTKHIRVLTSCTAAEINRKINFFLEEGWSLRSFDVTDHLRFVALMEKRLVGEEKDEFFRNYGIEPMS